MYIVYLGTLEVATSSSANILMFSHSSNVCFLSAFDSIVESNQNAVCYGLLCFPYTIVVNLWLPWPLSVTLTRLALTSSLKKIVIIQSRKTSAMMETLIPDIPQAGSMLHGPSRGWTGPDYRSRAIYLLPLN